MKFIINNLIINSLSLLLLLLFITNIRIVKATNKSYDQLEYYPKGPLVKCHFL